jgi:hypothetical protein
MIIKKNIEGTRFVVARFIEFCPKLHQTDGEIVTDISENMLKENNFHESEKALLENLATPIYPELRAK